MLTGIPSGQRLMRQAGQSAKGIVVRNAEREAGIRLVTCMG